MLKDGNQGFIYVLFEHKSYYDKCVHLLLLFKYIFTPELHHKLPEIFSLLRTLRGKEKGLQYLEVVVRYLASALDEDELSKKAISKETGEYVMTLAEKLKNEGKLEG